MPTSIERPPPLAADPSQSRRGSHAEIDSTGDPLSGRPLAVTPRQPCRIDRAAPRKRPAPQPTRSSQSKSTPLPAPSIPPNANLDDFRPGGRPEVVKIRCWRRGWGRRGAAAGAAGRCGRARWVAVAGCGGSRWRGAVGRGGGVRWVAVAGCGRRSGAQWLGAVGRGGARWALRDAGEYCSWVQVGDYLAKLPPNANLDDLRLDGRPLDFRHFRLVPSRQPGTRAIR
jgi:hypothetical protein